LRVRACGEGEERRTEQPDHGQSSLEHAPILPPAAAAGVTNCF